MRVKSDSYFASFIFIFVFIVSHSVIAVIPTRFNKPFLIALFAGCIICAFYVVRSKFSKVHMGPLLLTLSFVTFGTVNIVIHQSVEMFNIIGPIFAYIGYIFIRKKGVKLGLFDFFLIGMYIYYYFVYYSVIPDLFFRPGFDEDEAVFENSSSNAIPISLNITLYAYMIFSRYYKKENKGKLTLFALANLMLIIIQQSRAGLVIALLLFIIACYEYSKEALGFLTILVAAMIVVNLDIILGYMEVIGNLQGVGALEEDPRGEAQAAFFEHMDFFTIIFGHSSSDYTELDYTYNVFLDMWDRYGLTQVLLFFAVVAYRVINRRVYDFPLYFFIPFFAYSFVESIFLPKFWDVIIYMMLFEPKLRTAISKKNYLDPPQLQANRA